MVETAADTAECMDMVEEAEGTAAGCMEAVACAEVVVDMEAAATEGRAALVMRWVLPATAGQVQDSQEGNQRPPWVEAAEEAEVVVVVDMATADQELSPNQDVA